MLDVKFHIKNLIYFILSEYLSISILLRKTVNKISFSGDKNVGKCCKYFRSTT